MSEKNRHPEDTDETYALRKKAYSLLKPIYNDHPKWGIVKPRVKGLLSWMEAETVSEVHPKYLPEFIEHIETL